MNTRRSPTIVPRSTFGRLSGAGKSRTPRQTPPFGMWTFQRNSPLCYQNLLATAKKGSCSAPQILIANSRSEEHTSELQSRENLVCRLLLEKKKKKYEQTRYLYPLTDTHRRQTQ